MLAFLRTPGPVRRFLLASLQSSMGNAIGYVALLLLAYDHFRSPWAVSLVLLADFLPAILLGPLFGALADRWSRRMLVVGADVLRAAAFAGLAFADSFASCSRSRSSPGLGTALYHPASKAALAGLAGKRAEDAMGALVTIWSAASVAGPALGAALLLAVSTSVLLLLNAATFLVSALVLNRLALDREETVHGAVATSDNVNLAIAAGELVTAHEADVAIGHGVRAGLRAAHAVPGLSAIVGAGAAATLAFSLMNVAEPLLATDELDAGEAGFALLVCAFGIGSTLGALRGRADVRLLVGGLAGGGLALCASALAPSLARRRADVPRDRAVRRSRDVDRPPARRADGARRDPRPRLRPEGLARLDRVLHGVRRRRRHRVARAARGRCSRSRAAGRCSSRALAALAAAPSARAGRRAGVRRAATGRRRRQRATAASASTASSRWRGSRRMWLCWLIERGATPIASTGGALESSGTTTRSSTGTDQGQRPGSAGLGTSVLGSSRTSATPNTQRQPEA